ncbi:CPBP family intramembrane glutamic endopeptidase [Paenibacillus albiflavus]|uniref:CPBP family intramembrane glutamic endopeptidase n=1 Tax=Paenibacillus albiflavus TaxID=2545760 RepID=UPI001404C7C5|nr:CPBP family intramembrane glutamic endopeptidase [Paenibacillus albiflavus]
MDRVKVVNKDRKMGYIILYLLSLLALCGLNLLVPETKLLWYLGAVVVSSVLWWKNRNINHRDVGCGVVLGGLAFFPYYFMGVATFFAYIGAVSVFKKSKHKIKFLKETNRRGISVTLLFIVTFGIVLGTINVFLNDANLNPGIQLYWICRALTAGICEEIIFRFLLFSIFATIIGNKDYTRLEGWISYFIMIVPHVLIHFDMSSINLLSVIVLSVVFGLPFALLQRKRDLTSAMGSHFIVDLIRFVTFQA